MVTSSAAFATVGVDQTGLATGTYNGSICGHPGRRREQPAHRSCHPGGQRRRKQRRRGRNLTFSPSSTFILFRQRFYPRCPDLDGERQQYDFVRCSSIISYSQWLRLVDGEPLLRGHEFRSVGLGQPTGLATGTYTATIPFNANGVIQNVGVTLTVNSSGGGNTGNVTVSPTSLTFTSQQGSSPAAQNVNVSSASGSAGVSFTVQVTTTAAPICFPPAPPPIPRRRYP